jgi:hypothetical protein
LACVWGDEPAGELLNWLGIPRRHQVLHRSSLAANPYHAWLAELDEPLVMLAGIATRVRDLVRVRSLPPKTPLAEVARRAGLRFDWQARRYRDQARRFTPEALSAIHAELVEADRSLKQGGRGDTVLVKVVARIGEAGGGASRAG